MEIVSAVVGSLVSKIAELSAEPVIKQSSYMFCVNNFVKEFSEQWRILALARRRVQHAVDVAIRNAEEIETDVNKWLEDAKKALAVYGLQDAVDVATKNAEEIAIDVKKWLEDVKNEMDGVNRLENEKGKNGKCFTWCPKWICQFKLSKALEKKTETLRKLEEESKKFTKVAHQVPLQDIKFLPSKEFTSSESSNEALEHIMKALKDDSVNMIGLYGMGGVGKTTLVKEVCRRANKSRLFDEVLMAIVSKNPNVRDIQDQLADHLDLYFKETTIQGRANRLWKRLKTEKKMLVILDDVWQYVDLEEIGISFGDYHRGCKVLLITRFRDICSFMKCQPIVFLNILSENEAWDLFKFNAGLRDGDSKLKTVAKKVARECQGLPIALVTVGRALRDKSTNDWEVAFRRLKNSELQSMDPIGGQKSTYACLKLSYDYLQNKAKLCFLLCCLFPEDYYIPIEDLTRYAVGYGLYPDVESIEHARENVYWEINTLKGCCMLLGTETEEKVKMHDLVRDVAIEISSEEYGFMVKAGVGSKEWSIDNKSFESCQAISLMGNRLTELPEGLVCPQLKVLLLELDDNLRVPERFFEGMKEIQVLSVKGGCLSLQSLEFSTNLQSLLLIECECKDLIWLRKLQRLKILGFIGLISVQELPDEIGELKELLLLDVTGCRDICTLFLAKWRQALNNLTSVEIGDCESLEEVFELGEADEGSREVNELQLLSSLTRLELRRLPELKCIWKGPTRHVSLRSLVHLELQFLDKLTFIFTPSLARSLVHLETLRIDECSGLKHLIREMDDEREIIPESLGFLKLKTLFIRGCDKMEYVFPVSVSTSFLNLEEMEIELGASLNHIFYSGEGDALTRDGIINFPHQLPSLQILTIEGHQQWGDLLAQLQGHINLRKICITDCKGEDRRTGHELSLEEEDKKFQKVAHKAPLQDIEFLPSKEFTPSESSKEAFEQIMKALKDDNVNMIGLYGMGGVGKTTLVREVGRRAKETQLFDEVLFAIVSKNTNVMYIQDQIADCLGLQFDVRTKEGRAALLWQRLKTEKKKLVILDDVWKVVNLKEIGIPFGDDHRGCKVLLTTRRTDICSDMECQQRVLLRLLSENEAWALFKINAGLRDDDSNLNTVAKEVVRVCLGLPITLVTVGRALRGKSVIEWEVASTELKNSEFQHMEQNNAYACLKLSYDYLKHEKTKLCFLLCCLFPEDYNIPIEDLTRYAVGYGLHQDVESIEDVRNQVYVVIKTLKDCCMLLGTETEENVKMHDLVRAVAIQIASKEHGFMVKAGIGLKEWPRSNKSFEGCTTISLMGNKLEELPEGLVCPQLKVLLLELDDNLRVPERFFEGMKEIQVLSLKGGCLSLQSLEFSTYLQSLLLIRCKCYDLNWLRKLQRLEILCFIWCFSVKELPIEIGELKELRLLDVTDCTCLRRIPVNLIGGLKKLEELLIGRYSFEGWGVVGCDSTGGMNASLTELNLLSHLAVLSLRIPRVKCIPRDFVFPRLLKYDIVLGNGYLRTEHPTSRRLYLHDISATSLNVKTFEQLFPTVSQIGFIKVEGLENIALSNDQMTSHGHGSQKDFFQSLEDVEVKGCRDIHTLFPAKWRQALNNLTCMAIEYCESLEEVFELGEAGEGINEEELRLLSSLTRLELRRLPELKCIWKGPTRHVSLRSLVHLELQFLDKLTFIFTPSLARSLVHLETLRIDECSGLKHLIREMDDEREIIPESLGFLKLKTLFIRGCDKLEYVFPVSVSTSLLNLEEMEIELGASLKHIFYSGEGDAFTRDGIINFPQLRKLSLSNCYSFFGPKNFTAQLPSLQVLYIEEHEELGYLLAQLQVSQSR